MEEEQTSKVLDAFMHSVEAMKESVAAHTQALEVYREATEKYNTGMGDYTESVENKITQLKERITTVENSLTETTNPGIEEILEYGDDLKYIKDMLVDISGTIETLYTKEAGKKLYGLVETSFDKVESKFNEVAENYHTLLGYMTTEFEDVKDIVSKYGIQTLAAIEDAKGRVDIETFIKENNALIGQMSGITDIIELTRDKDAGLSDAYKTRGERLKMLLLSNNEVQKGPKGDMTAAALAGSGKVENPQYNAQLALKIAADVKAGKIPENLASEIYRSLGLNVQEVSPKNVEDTSK